MQDTILIVILFLCLLLCAAVIWQSILLYKLYRERSGQEKSAADTEKTLLQLQSSLTASQESASRYFEQMAQLLRQEQREAFAAQEEKLQILGRQSTDYLADARRISEALRSSTEERMRTFSTENEQKLDAIRRTVQDSLTVMRHEQNKQLDEMRQVVDEKMQKVLNERMQQAFSAVNERLEQVHKGLGEMQTLAVGVGDLKKLLTNVKARGEIGEIQLGALLSDLLAEEQYVQNARLGKGIVEFAVRMPSQDDHEVFLPIDAKFAGDTYRHLQEAYESGDKTAITEARKALCARIRSEAADIRDKYIAHPQTTDFGILFLPTEGLYTEAVRFGLPDEIFRKYRVFITGPTTIAAMLSTLRMGFQSISVQKYSDQVWQLLGEVRTEFNKFADALIKTQDKLHSASDELEKLVGTRTRMMQRRLNGVQQYLTEADLKGDTDS